MGIYNLFVKGKYPLGKYLLRKYPGWLKVTFVRLAIGCCVITRYNRMLVENVRALLSMKCAAVRR